MTSRDGVIERRPPSLDRVAQDLGRTVLEHLLGEPERSAAVGGVVIYDAEDEGPFPPNAIWLGIGISDNGSAMQLAPLLEVHSAVALIVRSPFEVGSDLSTQLDRAGVCLFGLAQGATWHQLTTVLGVSLADPGMPALNPETLGGMPAGDLFGMANAICALVDAPVTIEDRNGNVIAFSDHQEDVDFVRIECILGRRTPDLYAKEDELRGAMRALRRSSRPVFLEPIELDDERDAMPRVAVAIRAGDEILGAIWAVVREPFSVEREDLLLDASRLVALHMLQIRAGADVEQRLVADLVATALEGGPDGSAAVARLGVGGVSCVVVAAMVGEEPPVGGPIDTQALARRAAQRERVATALALHLSATRTGSVVAAVGDTVYAIVPAQRPHDAEVNIESTCRNFVQRSSIETRLLVGIGRIASDASELARSRADADRAVRVLRSSERDVAVTRASDVEVEALLLELRDLALGGDRGPTRPYAQLLAYDAAHKTSMVDTLCAWLDAHGDIVAAADASGVHQNTFRYRLKRLAEIGEFELDDPRARFGLELQLRIFPPGRALAEGSPLS